MDPTLSLPHPQPNAPQGFVFEFTANPNNCQLYTTLGTRDPNVYTGSNIYVLPGVQCPVPI